MRIPKTGRQETQEEKAAGKAATDSLYDRDMTEEESDCLVVAYNATAQLLLMTRLRLRDSGTFGALPLYTNQDKEKGLGIQKVETGKYIVSA